MSEELSNVFSGHMLPRRKEGDLEVVDIALFNPDGSPFALPIVPEVPIEIPPGGETGAVLAKASAESNDLLWVQPIPPPEVPVELPTGGASGAFLAKASGADGDVEWVALPEIPEIPETEAWHNLIDADMDPSFGWTTIGSIPPQYRKRPDGTVEMRGIVVPGNQGTIFTLPVGYRHNAAGNLYFPVGGQANNYAIFKITPAGALAVESPNTAGLQVANWWGLAPIQFSVG